MAIKAFWGLDMKKFNCFKYIEKYYVIAIAIMLCGIVITIGAISKFYNTIALPLGGVYIISSALSIWRFAIWKTKNHLLSTYDGLWLWLSFKKKRDFYWEANLKHAQISFIVAVCVGALEFICVAILFCVGLFAR